LQQVFWNLINNAAKFTPSGETITIRSANAKPQAPGRLSAIVVEVTDTGVGIEPDVLPRIFDAFEQGDSGRHAEVRRAGIGLAISNRLIAMHGGRLSAASEGRGRGATFTVELATTRPAADARPRATAPSVDTPGGERGAGGGNGALRI